MEEGIRIMLKLKYYLLALNIEIILLILSLLITYNFISMPAKKITFYLSDNNITTLLKTLNQVGYNTYDIDKYLLKFITLPKRGWYTLEAEKVGRLQFFKSLHNKRAKTMHINIYAGETAQELTQRLANDMKLDADKLLKAYTAQSIYEQADIFSGQYTLARDADANTSMDFLFKKSHKILNQFIDKYYYKKPNTLEIKALLIVASIIQKESNSIEEMPLIASVIYNRLEKHMKLQMDGTLNYGKFAHTIITPERIKTDESAYNTYKHKGIPPAPLGTVSIKAVEAAYHPARSKYLFFMLKKDGSHHFAQTYEEHLKNIHAFKSKSKENNISKIKSQKI